MNKYRMMKRRIISLILTGMMVIGNIPASVWASDESPSDTTKSPVTDFSGGVGFGEDFKETTEKGPLDGVSGAMAVYVNIIRERPFFKKILRLFMFFELDSA